MTLKNGIEIRILVGDWRTVRGPSVCCAVVDEVCFFGLSEESHVRSDAELIRAIRPSLATTQGKLVAISSKYARKGWAYQTWQKFHGSNHAAPSFSPTWATLVWDSPSKTMNPTLSQTVIDAAYAEDPAAARSEFGGEWRDDVAEFCPRSLIEALVVRGRKELLPRSNIGYSAFCDLSGGRNDDASLAVGHREGQKVILDSLRVWRAPMNPHAVILEMADALKRWSLRRVVGDNYGAEFVTQSFRSLGITYSKADLPKSGLYRELLPRMCSGEIELLDNEQLVTQLAGLERRTRSGGQDIIDHPKGGKDDLANAVAGVAVMLSKGTVRAGGIRELAMHSRFVCESM